MPCSRGVPHHGSTESFDASYRKCTTIQGMCDSRPRDAHCVCQPGKPHPQVQTVILSMDFFLQERGQGEHLTPTEVHHVTLQGSAFKTAASVSTGVTSAPWAHHPGQLQGDDEPGSLRYLRSGQTSQENSSLGKRHLQCELPCTTTGAVLRSAHAKANSCWIRSIWGCLQGIRVYQIPRTLFWSFGNFIQ